MQYQSDPAYMLVIPHVLNAEGGYVDHPNDPGGPTKYGIAWNYNQGILQGLGITRATMRNLTLEQARQIYYEKYWLASGAHRIPDIRLAYNHFDAAVNHGVGAASRFRSRLQPQPDWYEGNGKNEALFLILFLQYLAQRLRAYSGDRNAATFLRGWVNRMAHLCEVAIKLPARFRE